MAEPTEPTEPDDGGFLDDLDDLDAYDADHEQPSLQQRIADASLMVIVGAVALIVIGPEKLPKVARTLGHLVGKAQRYVADVKAVIAWLRQELKLPVWLIGTSNGTRSAAYVATQLPPADGGADGLVLTSTVLTDRRGVAVPAMALGRINVPVLVTHHRLDSCRVTLAADVAAAADDGPAAGWIPGCCAGTDSAWQTCRAKPVSACPPSRGLLTV